MQRWCAALCVALMGAATVVAQSQFWFATDSFIKGGFQFRGLVSLKVDGKSVDKRAVIRVPTKWNGSLVIGAHGGSGGNAVRRSGKVYATSETALDDVIGDYAFHNGFAYASLDRDGIGGTRSGYALTMQFASMAKRDVTRWGKATPRRMYIVGLSAGGGITRMIAEAMPSPFDGALIIAGAGGDVITRMDRQQRMAALWPLIDPRAHAGLSDKDPKVVSYAEAIGTPVEARRLWPYTGAGAAAAGARPEGAVENSTATPSIPTIEVVGTWDDLVIREVRAYRDRVEPKDRHRLYQVEGVWHMSGDDDGVQGFQFAAESRMKLDKDVADAMGEGPSYIPTVRDAFDHLVRWVEKGTHPPASQTVKPGTKLR
ncbi:MAG TPA: alpha/beta hydrolase domain-containing protein [Vicinamibacterales bacterium]|nr:alpha/beta hydrolase domain-containing protein [Vicinamibacterales bacterium]